MGLFLYIERGMATMARVDDYIQARQIAAEKLGRQTVADIARQSGVEQITPLGLQLRFLDRVYRIAWPDCEFVDTDDGERPVPIQEQVLILHYLLGAGGRQPSGNWIAYREIPGAAFYFSAFVKRAVDPLKKVFGGHIEGFRRAADLLGGVEAGVGDVGREFRVLPQVPLRLILWAGDDEFPPEANILFDDTAGEILSPEDAAWLAGMLVYRMMALARSS